MGRSADREALIWTNQMVSVGAVCWSRNSPLRYKQCTLLAPPVSSHTPRLEPRRASPPSARAAPPENPTLVDGSTSWPSATWNRLPLAYEALQSGAAPAISSNAISSLVGSMYAATAPTFKPPQGHQSPQARRRPLAVPRRSKGTRLHVAEASSSIRQPK